MNLKEKLEQAQSLLSDVYHYACEHGLSDVQTQMSVADGCIIDALDSLGDTEVFLDINKTGGKW